MKKILIGIILLVVINLNANKIGKELFAKKCASCHSILMPKDKSTMLAPPVRGIMHHMKEEFSSNEEIIKHIKSFVINPTKEDAICQSVQFFGLMPSQKGNVSKEELGEIAKWMITLNMTKEEHLKAFGKLP